MSNSLIENWTNYSMRLRKTSKPDFFKIRNLSSEFVTKLPQEAQDELYNEMNRGTLPLGSEPEMSMYMFAYGKMHYEKLLRAFEQIPNTFFENEIEIIDYGCGQAMGLIAYADYINQKGYNQKITKITLIEPSKLTIGRAILHANQIFPTVTVNAICKSLDDLVDADIQTDANTQNLHIFSNIIDVELFSINKLSDFIKQTYDGNNQFVCVSPFFGSTSSRANRLDEFMNLMAVSNVYSEDLGKNDWINGWTCSIRVFQLNNNELEKQNLYKIDWNGAFCGFMDFKGKMITPYKYENAFIFSDGTGKVKLHKKWGFVDSKGNEFTSIKYDYVESFNDGFAIVENRDKRGLINEAGVEITNIQFDDVDFFFEDLAMVDYKGKKGFIDKNGKVAIPSKYIDGFSFSDGLAAVRLGNRWGFIDKNGNDVIPFQFDRASSFKDGLAIVLFRGKSMFINKQGEIAIPIEYDKVMSFSEDLAAVTVNGKWGFIDKQGKVAIPIKFGYVDSFNDGIARVLGNKFGFIDKSGEDIIPLIYTDAENFNEGLAKVKLNDKYGFINKKGEVIIPIEYDFVDSFCEGLVIVRSYDKYGFIDKQGKIAIPIKYDGVNLFREGIAIVVLDGKHGLIDKEGKEIIPIQYDSVLQDGLITATLNYNESYFNNLGDIVELEKSENKYDTSDNNSESYFFESNYSEYGGIYGCSDDTIDDCFEGDPDNYWNID